VLLTSVFCFLAADCAAPCRSEYDSDVDSGLGGRLDMRGVLLGGRGNAPMLETFRRPGKEDRGVCEELGDLWGVAKVVLSVGTTDADCVLLDFGVGKAEAVTERGFDGVGKAVLGVRGCSSGGSGTLGSLVLEMGNDGRGFEGGAIGGRDGRWMVEVMVAVAVMLWPSVARRQPAAFHRVAQDEWMRLLLVSSVGLRWQRSNRPCPLHFRTAHLSLTLQGVGTLDRLVSGTDGEICGRVSLFDAESGELAGRGVLIVQGYRCQFRCTPGDDWTNKQSVHLRGTT
jgi:hypothetical protein